MTDERYIAIWDARAALCRAHGDEISADYWTEQAERLSDRIEAARTRDDLLRAAVREALAQPGEFVSGLALNSLRAAAVDKQAVIDDEVAKVSRRHCAPVSFYAKPANA